MRRMLAEHGAGDCTIEACKPCYRLSVLGYLHTLTCVADPACPVRGCRTAYEVAETIGGVHVASAEAMGGMHEE